MYSASRKQFHEQNAWCMGTMATARKGGHIRLKDCTLLMLAALCCHLPCLAGGRRGSWTNSGEESLDPSLLQLPEVLAKVRRAGQIYNDTGDLLWPIKDGDCNNPPAEGKQTEYCPTVSELTVDFKRKPMYILQTRCKTAACGVGCKEVDGTRDTTGLCKNLSHFRRVWIKNRGFMFQNFPVGCYCDVAKPIN